MDKKEFAKQSFNMSKAIKTQASEGFSSILLIKEKNFDKSSITIAGNGEDICNLYAEAMNNIYELFVPKEVSFEDFMNHICDMANRRRG